jgi:hypothetical protein
MNQTSGAAFIEVEHVASTRDHFRQAVTDLGALSRSLREGNWQAATGYPFATDQIFYVGQSLGGILGATYTPLDPTITRAVLNVPGADVVPMFTDSLVFGGHVDAFLEREGIAHGSADHWRFMNVAAWFMDSVDPAHLAPYLMDAPLPGVGMPPGRDVIVQMATLDFVIPNANTIYLAELAGVPRRDYLGEHAFLTIPVEPAFLRGTREAAAFLAGELEP